MDNKKENIIENEIEVQVKEDNGAVLEYARMTESILKQLLTTEYTV